MIRHILFFSLFAASCALPQPGVRYIITNKCPRAVDVYVADQKVGRLPNGRSITTQPVGQFNGWIYTDANGGFADGHETTKVGFRADVRISKILIECQLVLTRHQTGYYFITKDPDNFNVGVSVAPTQASVSRTVILFDSH